MLINISNAMHIVFAIHLFTTKKGIHDRKAGSQKPVQGVRRAS